MFDQHTRRRHAHAEEDRTSMGSTSYDAGDEHLEGDDHHRVGQGVELHRGVRVHGSEEQGIRL